MTPQTNLTMFMYMIMEKHVQTEYLNVIHINIILQMVRILYTLYSLLYPLVVG